VMVVGDRDHDGTVCEAKHEVAAFLVAVRVQASSASKKVRPMRRYESPCEECHGTVPFVRRGKRKVYSESEKDEAW